MRPADWAIVILAPILLFLLILFVLWITWGFIKPVNPISPTGFTGITGFTGMTGITGMTGPDFRRLIEQAVKNDLKVCPEIDPLSVLDIVSINCSVIVLTQNQELILHDSGGEIQHRTPSTFKNIVGLNNRLYALDFSGKLWVLLSDLDDKHWDFSPVEEVNSKGSIIWVNTTLDQKFLWVTFNPSSKTEEGGILFDDDFNIIDTSSDHMYRIYGRTVDKFIVLNPVNHTLRLTNGYIFSSVAAAVLDCNNDLHTIPIQESPPLTGFRIICSEIYILITLPKGSNVNMMQQQLMQNQLQPQNQPQMAVMQPVYIP